MGSLAAAGSSGLPAAGWAGAGGQSRVAGTQRRTGERGAGEGEGFLKIAVEGFIKEFFEVGVTVNFVGPSGVLL